MGFEKPSRLYAEIVVRNKLKRDPVQQKILLEYLDPLSLRLQQYDNELRVYLKELENWKRVREKAVEEYQRRKEAECDHNNGTPSRFSTSPSDAFIKRKERESVIKGDFLQNFISWDRISYALRKVRRKSGRKSTIFNEKEEALEIPDHVLDIPSRPQEPVKPQGVYLYGQVGIGKTFLMDTFFESLQLDNLKITTRRYHFHEFMLELHEKLFDIQSKQCDDHMDKLVSALLGDGCSHFYVFCFDEFQINDVVDAVLLKEVFQRMWKKRTIFISTSNRAPEELNRSHLRKSEFEGFLNDLITHCDIIALESSLDYRKQFTGISRGFFHPLSEPNRKLMYQMFLDTSASNGSPMKVPLKVKMGRSFVAENAFDDSAFFEFAELCERPLGAADYLSIAIRFRTVFLWGIPRLSISKRDSARRFITLIDQLYNQKTRLICCSECSIDDLFTAAGGMDAAFIAEQIDGDRGNWREDKSSRRMFGASTLFTGEDEQFAFERAVSRLHEMQSDVYGQSRSGHLNSTSSKRIL